MNRHLSVGHGPEDHHVDLYIDTEAMVRDRVATADEIVLIELAFSLIVDMEDGHGGCQGCGLMVFEEVADTPGIVEAAMHVVDAASASLGLVGTFATREGYDCFSPEDRKAGLFDLGEYWADVVVKMRTCGQQCAVCAKAGPYWREIVGNH